MMKVKLFSNSLTSFIQGKESRDWGSTVPHKHWSTDAKGSGARASFIAGRRGNLEVHDCQEVRGFPYKASRAYFPGWGNKAKAELEQWDWYVLFPWQVLPIKVSDCDRPGHWAILHFVAPKPSVNFNSPRSSECAFVRAEIFLIHSWILG